MMSKKTKMAIAIYFKTGRHRPLLRDMLTYKLMSVDIKDLINIQPLRAPSGQIFTLGN